MRGHAALKSAPFLGSLRELDPICRKPKPGLFVEWADRLLRLFSAFLDVLAESLCVCLGHDAEIMHKVKLGHCTFQNRPLRLETSHHRDAKEEIGNLEPFLNFSGSRHTTYRMSVR